MQVALVPTIPLYTKVVTLVLSSSLVRAAIGRPVVTPFLLAFSVWLAPLPTVTGCFHCDQRFLDSVGKLMEETLPEDLPNRDALIERHVQSLADLYGTFFRKKYERVLDVRQLMSFKSDILSYLQEVKKNTTWKGVFLWQLSMYQLRTGLRKRMKQTLEKFADLACSEDCTVTEGPVLDCWTCLRIVAQCFDGELCGVEDKRLAEYNEIVLYVFLVCESVVLTSIVLIYLVCFKHKRKMLEKILAQ